MMYKLARTYYEKDTGIIVLSLMSNDESTLDMNKPDDCEYIEGYYESHKYMIKNNKAIKLPDRPSGDHVYDINLESWVLPEKESNIDYIENRIKLRNSLLKESDWTQMPDSPLTLEKKAEWAAYRQTLRDITEQETFPDVIWPEKPE